MSTEIPSMSTYKGTTSEVIANIDFQKGSHSLDFSGFLEVCMSDVGKDADMVYLDFAKAFDKVP